MTNSAHRIHYPDQLKINTCGPLDATIDVPGSKSITNRALICAALADGISELRGALDCEDTQVMIAALQSIGVPIDSDWRENKVTVKGCNGILPIDNGTHTSQIDIAGSGTSMRFLTGMLCLGAHSYRLTGNSRMQQRPIGDLVEALRELGCELKCESDSDCPPILINAHGIRGGAATVKGNVSSQYLSALLMAAPYADEPVQITVDGKLVSTPYVKITTEVMEAFGLRVETNPEYSFFKIPNDRPYHAIEYQVEPDATAASYFWAAAAICGGSATVNGLSRDSMQGDIGFVDALKKMGCKTIESKSGWTVIGPAKSGIDIDMESMSDTAQTLSAVALFVDGPTTIRGIAHNRFKETDRIADLATELQRVGARVEQLDDGLRIQPADLKGVKMETYHDHRMAMSFALVGLKQPGIIIDNPSCVAKTFPDFFERLKSLTVQTG